MGAARKFHPDARGYKAQLVESRQGQCGTARVSLMPNTSALIAGFLALVLCACAREFTYTHAVLASVDGLRPLELSKSSPDSQGKELAGEQLEIMGPNIHRVAPGSAEELEGHFYSFYFHETDSQFVSFTVRNARGNILGSEKLRYSVVGRGHQQVDTFGS